MLAHPGHRSFLRTSGFWVAGLLTREGGRVLGDLGGDLGARVPGSEHLVQVSPAFDAAEVAAVEALNHRGDEVALGLEHGDPVVELDEEQLRQALHLRALAEPCAVGEVGVEPVETRSRSRAVTSAGGSMGSSDRPVSKAGYSFTGCGEQLAQPVDRLVLPASVMS